MSNEPRATLTRKQEIAVRRLEKWMEPLSAAALSEADGPAYRALVDTLLGAMVAVGPQTGATASMVLRPAPVM